MTRASIFSLIAIAGFLAVPPLRAADDGKTEDSGKKAAGAEGGDALFQKLDANHNGFITSDEVPEESRRLFERLLRRADRNNDGKLSREEFIAGFAAGPGGPGNRTEGAPGGENTPRGFGFGAGGMGGGPAVGIAVFRALDTNGDGKLDANEIAAASDVLKKLAGSSGELTREDLLKTLPAEMAARAAGGGQGFGAGLAARNPEAAYKRMLEQFDKNGDGKIEKDELPRALQERFDELDANKDGSLDQSEIREILPRLMRRMQQQAQGEAAPGGGKKGKKSENN